MSSTHARFEPGPPPPGWNPPSHGPPPIPAGMNVNPQIWGRGAWQFNPAYNNAGRPPHQATVPWVAGVAWHGWQGTSHASAQAAGQSAAAAAASQAHNPYKRIPRPPSAEYMATKLLENPLGLTNMIPRNELRGQDGYPQSPWIWNPPGLISDESDDGVITADFRDEQGRRVAQEVRGPTPSRQGSHDREMEGPSHHDNTPLRRSSTNRPNEFSPPHHRDNDSPSMHSQNSRDSTPSRRSSNDSISASNRSTLPSLDRPLGRPKDPSSAYQQRFNSPGASDVSTRDSPSRSSFSSSSALSERTVSGSTQNEHPRNESFTSKGELHPTFSTNIVRTPDYYQSASRRNSHEDDTANRNSSSSMSNLTSRMERLGTSHTIQNSTALTRHSSMPSSAYASSSSSAVIAHPSDFVDEPANILSPLMMATPKVSARPVTRGLSVPDIRGGSGLSVIPEASPAPRGLSLPPISTRTSTSPVTPNRDRNTTPPSAHSHNPLPRPPYEVHSHVASAPPTRGPSPPPGSYSSRVRLGFWNRRGDHLTRTMHVVYAPPEKAYPRDLQGYPAETEGFRDHLGIFLPYDPDWPELPESLPRHGKPPMQPYSIFVVYDYRR